MMAHGGTWSRCLSNTSNGGPPHVSGSKHNMKQHRIHSLRETHIPRVTAARQRLVTSATESGPVAAPDVRPEQGLTEYRAFTGGARGSASNPSRATTGLGHLLLRNNNVNSGRADAEEAETQPSPPSVPTQKPQEIVARDIDAFEQHRLVQNDPISFNPLAAISWAIGDDSVEDKSRKQCDFAACGDEGRPVSQRHSRPLPTSAKGKSRQRSRKSGEKDAQSIAPLAAAVSRSADKRIVDRVEPDPLPYRKMLNTFPTRPQQITDTAQSCTPHMSPSTPSRVLRSHTRQASSQQPSVEPLQHPQIPEERGFRHRIGARTDEFGASAGSSPSASDAQQTSYPSLPAQVCMAPMTDFSVAQPPMVEPQTMPFQGNIMQPQHQVSLPQYPLPQYASPSPPPPPPPPRQYRPEQQQDPHQCLTSHYCSTSFPTEIQLNPNDCARQNHACNWMPCNSTGFTSENALMWHIRAEHLMRCPKPGCCNERFPTKKQLEMHVRVH
ncbi:hypothetical protein M406DRAFT_73833 [Cryphonectria parasitica EP155]|uniref:C2H2-type domain-containing protein n=1 Tax=Cryphonectria parasitica (strain ATCC 38755 / EP155) TaxID=660469 RepID=A0A9P4XXQ2_CRYP1|nr:uncharacterized protein M406DRAFT_73833 [Cryphonectria parasitica EP155]KAF3763209.1 hypothetical protein M406DRAFT_73833 [Cryphonectria parasitica EP155]